ncbi:hypothetical protein IT570_05105 [Candidatus Sumerlaeota bacterium]|nr:hypothetical protein [Candidatus Sumerlaeota bacterium]
MNAPSAAKKHGILTACACALAVTALLVPLFAQKDSPSHKDAKDTGNYAYRVNYVNQVLPARLGDDIKEVYKFPVYSSVFLVRMSNSITVWERKEKALATLLDIKLDGDFKDLLFLEDGKTFVIHTSRSASVYTLDREAVTPTVNTKKPDTTKSSK